MNVLQCYAHINDNHEDGKDMFNQRLQQVLEMCPEKELTILMEDLNDEVGMDNNGYEDIL